MIDLPDPKDKSKVVDHRYDERIIVIEIKPYLQTVVTIYLESPKNIDCN